MAVPPLNGLQAIKQAAAANGLDWRPLAAIAHHESGLNPAAVGDQGTSFGLFQLHQGGALPAGTPASQATNPLWNANFAARQIKGLNIQGLPVAQQIAQISRRFERPANPGAEIADAQRYYQTALAGSPAAAPSAGMPNSTAAGGAAIPRPVLTSAQSLAPLQAGFGLAQASNQRALDALGKLSGQTAQAPQAPHLSALTTSSSPQLQPTAVTVPLKGKTPHPIEADPQAAKAIALAKHYLGTKYVFGGASPSTGFDCSGLLQYVWAQNGVKIPRTAAEQFHAGKPVNPSHLQPGDALYFQTEGAKAGITHAAMYIGNGQILEAPHTGDVVKIIPLAGYYPIVGARRFA
jgi:cell wall-associated NlpC family hydrolase